MNFIQYSKKKVRVTNVCRNVLGTIVGISGKGLQKTLDVKFDNGEVCSLAYQKVDELEARFKKAQEAALRD